MPALVVAVAASAWLLVGAGLMKILRPRGTDGAIRVLTGSSGTLGQVRLLGLLELAVGSAFILVPTPLTSATLGGTYVLVLGSAMILRRRGADCGCFGASSTQVGLAHVVVTAVAAVSCFALTVAFDAQLSLTSHYILAAASIPVALGCYAVIAPLVALRTDLGELST